ncbi:DUF4349 domain-containing protein [Peribacillus loiseleuriae]|uniref:DUF4349 domain-containing protein n=1 Tax=Peribacillus loiseleuriae TaxID=1679170 RepID=UPI003816A3AE
MIKKVTLRMMQFGIIVVLAACSSHDIEQAKMSDDTASSSNEYSDSKMKNEIQDTLSKQDKAEEVVVTERERMVIHQAQLVVKVKKLEEAQLKIEERVAKYGGYIVESNVYREESERMNANITVRVPEAHFQDFLRDTEATAAEVLERNVTGQDVTEEYVDLQSRLKSKRTVEERLLEFMKHASKTEDLLKISADLAKVQEEIEQIVGKVKFLENQTSYSTISISLHENRVIVPSIDNQDLNTWEKTKKQLITSTNFLLAAGSGLIVFIIGNLPIIAFVVIVVGVAIWIFRKSGRQRQ